MSENPGVYIAMKSAVNIHGYSNLCEADSLGESSGAGPLNTECLLYVGFGRDCYMRSQKFSFTLNKGNKFGTLATDLLKAEFLFLFFL